MNADDLARVMAKRAELQALLLALREKTREMSRAEERAARLRDEMLEMERAIELAGSSP